MAWLRGPEDSASPGVLAGLVRANLHTRQYADLVGRVLRRLAPAGGVADADLAYLWDLAQKARRFLEIRCIRAENRHRAPQEKQAPIARRRRRLLPAPPFQNVSLV